MHHDAATTELVNTDGSEEHRCKRATHKLGRYIWTSRGGKLFPSPVPSRRFRGLISFYTISRVGSIFVLLPLTVSRQHIQAISRHCMTSQSGKCSACITELTEPTRHAHGLFNISIPEITPPPGSDGLHQTSNYSTTDRGRNLYRTTN